MTERYISPCPPPEGRPREVLVILAEECSEVTKRITKILRFGLDETQPGQSQTNAERLGNEIGDLLVMVEEAIKLGIVPVDAIEAEKLNRPKQLEKYLQTEAESTQQSM